MTKIQNPYQEVPHTPELNDRDFLSALLAFEKVLVKLYSTAITEASSNQHVDELTTLYNETKNLQHDIYNLMFEKGWHHIETESKQKLSELYIQYEAYKNSHMR